MFNKNAIVYVWRGIFKVAKQLIIVNI